MDVIAYFADHHAHFLFLLAGIGFVLELTVMGLSGPLLFFSVACLLTGFLSYFGLLNSWESEVLSVGVFSGLIAALLWQPLKSFQNSGGGPDTSSDMIGKHVPCAIEITVNTGAIRYSGINWTARLEDPTAKPIPEGAQCEICGVDGNAMIVKLLSS